MTWGDVGSIATAVGTVVALAGVIAGQRLARRGQDQDRHLAEVSALRAEAAARVTEGYTARVVEALERIASGQSRDGVIHQPRVRWSLTHFADETYKLENEGDATAFDVQLSGHPTLLGPDGIKGGPDLPPDGVLTFLAATSVTTEDTTITVRWRPAQGADLQSWKYPLPPINR